MKRLVLTGGDEESYRATTRLSSRLIAFPDGLTRHITLRDWEWNVYDWLYAEFRSVGWPAPEYFAFRSTLRWLPRDVLRRLQPPGWQRRPSIAFNNAAAPPPLPAVLAFRDNAESITGQAQRCFERKLRQSLRWEIYYWMYNRMGFRSLDAANEERQITPEWIERADALTDPQ
jgi:hypothetical protein